MTYSTNSVIELPGEQKHGTRPEDINEKNIYLGNRVVTEAAQNLIFFFQKKGGWVSFKILEFLEFTQQHNPPFADKALLGLLGQYTLEERSLQALPYLSGKGEDGVYAITDLFIKHCLMHQRENIKKEVS